MPSADMYIDLLAKEEADEGQSICNHGVEMEKWRGCLVPYRSLNNSDLKIKVAELLLD